MAFKTGWDSIGFGFCQFAFIKCNLLLLSLDTYGAGEHLALSFFCCHSDCDGCVTVCDGIIE